MHINTKMRKRFNSFAIMAILMTVLLSACSTPTNVSYFQDVANNCTLKLPVERSFRLKPQDKVNIIVNSKDPSLQALFTLTTVGTTTPIGAATTPLTVAGRGSTYSSSPIAYTVAEDGTIEFPVIGKVKAAGYTRQDVAESIRRTLIKESLVNDPIVTVEYVNMGVSVLGEVNRPGRINILKDHFTILDAISEAGDLTINGVRENVMVIRQDGDEQSIYTVNLCSAQNIVESPAYYLQQDDIVYVNPNPKRKRESLVSGNTALTPSFWISVASLLTTISALIIK